MSFKLLSVDAQRGSPRQGPLKASFRSLALDVLAGRPVLQAGTVRVPDSYELWLGPEDCRACALVRYAEWGQVVALAAVRPRNLLKAAQFEDSVARLAFSLESFELQPPDERAREITLIASPPHRTVVLLQQRLLELDQEGAIAFEPGVLGSPRCATRKYFEKLERLRPDLNRGSVSPGARYDISITAQRLH